MILLLIFILLSLWYVIGFSSLYISLKMQLFTLDREDYVFCSGIALCGVIAVFILLIEILTDYQRFKFVIKEIFGKPPPKKLTLKQLRLKKLKRINRFKWIRL